MTVEGYHVCPSCKEQTYDYEAQMCANCRFRRRYTKTRKMKVEVPEPLQDMLDRNTKRCNDCDRLIALIDCKLEDASVKTQLIDPFPVHHGWVRLPLVGSTDKRGEGWVRPHPPIPPDTLPFRRHSCRRTQRQ